MEHVEAKFENEHLFRFHKTFYPLSFVYNLIMDYCNMTPMKYDTYQQFDDKILLDLYNKDFLDHYPRSHDHPIDIRIYYNFHHIFHF